jgi:hypothetical protein
LRARILRTFDFLVLWYGTPHYEVGVHALVRPAISILLRFATVVWWYGTTIPVMTVWIKIDVLRYRTALMEGQGILLAGT